jgi:hypothetical protein
MEEFFVTHWHCILPVAAIALVLFLQNRGKRKNDEEG